MIKSTSLVCLIILCIGTAHAKNAGPFSSGIDIYTECNEKTASSNQMHALCLGYLMGFLDGISFAELTPHTCIPDDGISITHFMLIYNKYAKDYPTLLHESKMKSILGALYASYRCDKILGKY